MSNVIDLFDKRQVARAATEATSTRVPADVLDVLGISLPGERSRNTVTLADRTRDAQLSYEDQVRSSFFKLEGELRAGRFCGMVKVRENAYRYAELLIACCGDELNVRTACRRPLDPLLCEALNEWLSPAVPFTRYPSASVLACAMFGHAWAQLTQGRPASGLETAMRPALVANCPAFRPGLVDEPVALEMLPA